MISLVKTLKPIYGGKLYVHAKINSNSTPKVVASPFGSSCGLLLGAWRFFLGSEEASSEDLRFPLIVLITEWYKMVRLIPVGLDLRR